MKSLARVHKHYFKDFLPLRALALLALLRLNKEINQPVEI